MDYIYGKEETQYEENRIDECVWSFDFARIEITPNEFTCVN